MVASDGGGHAREGVEPTCEKDERRRAGGRGWSARGEEGDAAFGEGFKDDLPGGFVFEGSVDELCRASGQMVWPCKQGQGTYEDLRSPHH